MTGQPQPFSVQRRYWELIAAGLGSEQAGIAVGVSATCGGKWFRRFGGVNPRWLAPGSQIRPRLSADEREQIMIGTAQGESIRSMAARLGRAPSTVMREIANNGVMRGSVGRYRARYRFGARRAGVDAKSGYSARIGACLIDCVSGWA
jgi:transposase, IS30 family